MAEHILYIMRHGKTEWNAEHKIQGRKDSPLLIGSLEPARKIGAFLKGKGIRQVYVSPLYRARCTADVVCQYLEVPYCESNLLLECNHGLCEGMSLEQVKGEMPEFFTAREHNKWFVPWPEGESYADVFERAARFISTELTLQQNNLIIAHEMINKCILGVLLHWDKKETMEFKQANSELLIIRANRMEVVDFK